MNLKIACCISIVLTAGSLLLLFPGYLINYYPMLKEAPDMSVTHLYMVLVSLGPTLIVNLTGAAGYIIFLLSLIFRTQKPRSGTVGLIAAVFLLALATLGGTGLYVMYTRNAFQHITQAHLILYITCGVLSFIDGIILCLFIVMLLQNAACTVALAWTRIVLTVLFFLGIVGNHVLAVQEYPPQGLYMVSSILLFAGVCMSNAADLLAMTAYVCHARTALLPENAA